MTTKPETLRTPPVTLGPYPKFFEQGLPDDNGKRYYEADLLISPEGQKSAEFANLKAAAKSAVEEKWPKDKPGNLRSPFRPASEKKRQKDNSSYYPEETFPGYMVLRVKTLHQPGIVNGKNQQITDSLEIYGGCVVRCSVHPFAYQVKGNAGVSFWLNNVQKIADGEMMGGGMRSNAENDFEPIAEDAGQNADDLFS